MILGRGRAGGKGCPTLLRGHFKQVGIRPEPNKGKAGDVRVSAAPLPGLGSPGAPGVGLAYLMGCSELGVFVSEGAWLRMQVPKGWVAHAHLVHGLK